MPKKQILFNHNLEHCQFESVLKIRNYTIKRVDSVRFLGFFLDLRLKRNEHVRYAYDKVSKGLSMLRLCYNLLPH